MDWKLLFLPNWISSVAVLLLPNKRAAKPMGIFDIVMAFRFLNVLDCIATRKDSLYETRDDLELFNHIQCPF